MEKLKKIFTYKPHNYIFIPILEFVMCLVFIYSLFNIFYMKSINNIWSLKDLILGVPTGFISICIIVRNFIVDKGSLEKFFLTIAIPLSIAYLVFVLPLKVPDEGSHLFRVFNIARGNVIISKEENEENTPIEFKQIEDRMQKYTDLFAERNADTHANKDGNERRTFNAAETYFPIVYIGPAIAGVLCNIINLNIIDMIYLMRLFNIIIYLTAGYFTIKCLPFGKLLMMTYLCIPMLLHQAASISADCFINSMTLLFIAYNMKLLFQKSESFTKKEKIIYVVLALLATLNKSAYVPLIFISALLLFNKDNPKNKKDKLFIIATFCITLFITVGWYLFGAGYTDNRQIIVDRNISSSAQLSIIFGNPKAFLKTLFFTLYDNASLFLFQAIGSTLGCLEINVSLLPCILYLILLILSPFLEKSNYRLNGFQKFWLIALTFGMILLICVAMYIGWTNTGADRIDGIQGRYFLPILILPLLCLIPKNKFFNFKYTVYLYSILILGLNCYSLQTVFNYFIR